MKLASGAPQGEASNTLVQLTRLVSGVLLGTEMVHEALRRMTELIGARDAMVFEVDEAGDFWARSWGSVPGTEGAEAPLARSHLGRPEELTATGVRTLGALAFAERVWFPQLSGPVPTMVVYPVVEAEAQIGGLIIAGSSSGRHDSAYDALLLAFGAACRSALRHDDVRRTEANRRAGDRLLGGIAELLWDGQDLETVRLEEALGHLGAHLGLEALLLTTNEERIQVLADWADGDTRLPTPVELAAVQDRWHELATGEPYRWHGNSQAPIGSLAAAFEYGTSGEVIEPPTGDGRVATVIAVAPHAPLPPAAADLLGRLASTIRNFVLRSRLQAGVGRRSELQTLQSRASELFLSSGDHKPDDVIREVLERVAVVFDTDEVLWGSRAGAAQPVVVCRYRRSDGRFEVLSRDRNSFGVPAVDVAEPVVRVRPDSQQMRRLGVDIHRYPEPALTLVALRDTVEVKSRIGLLDYEDKPGRPAEEHEVLIDLNRLFRQYRSGQEQRAEAALRRRYDKLRLAVADHLIRNSDASVDDLVVPALGIVGRAFGADYVRLQSGDPKEGGVAAVWNTPDGSATVKRLIAKDPGDFVLGDTFEAVIGNRTGIIREKDLPQRSQAVLDAAGIHEADLVGLAIVIGEELHAIAVARFGRTAWGATERALLASLGTQIQLAADAVRNRAKAQLRSEMDDMVSRAASTLIDEVDIDRALDSVLKDIVETAGAQAAHWGVVDSADHTTVLRAWFRPGIDDPVPVVSYTPVEWARTWGAIGEVQFFDTDSSFLTSVATKLPCSELPARTIAPVLNAQGGLTSWLAVLTERALDPVIENALSSVATLIHQVDDRHRADRLLATTFESAPSGQLIVDHAGLVRVANAAIRERFGELEGTKWSELDPTFVAGGPEREVALFVGTQRIWTRIRSAVIDGNRFRPTTVVHVEDITAQRLARATLEFEAMHDSLTGLGNRRMLDQQVLDVSAQDESTVVMVDVDRFKVVNDSLGHSAGDQVLNAIATRLRATCTDTDVVCRFGGDEFVILLRGQKGRQDLEALASRVLDAVRAPIDVHGVSLRMTCSLGIASGPQGIDCDTLLRQSDAALHDAKAQGRDRYRFFAAGSAHALRERLTMESAMRSGLDRGEFFPYYQPEYDLTTGRIVGLEALVRWDRAGVVVEASEFIDVAEEIGLAPVMSQLMLEASCRQAQKWKQMGLDASIRVNVTAAQLRSGSLHLEVLSALDACELPPDSLCIEVTERSLLVDLDATIGTLAELQSAGVEIAIDDFGTGFSSLAWLKRLPVDTIKIDRSFVANIAENEADRKIAETIVALAQALKLGVVAEGVEQQNQVEVLIDLGCERAQGWLWSAALHPDDVPALLSDALPLT